MSNQQQVMVVLGANIANFQSTMSTVQQSMNNTASHIQSTMNNVEETTSSSVGGIKEAIKGIAGTIAAAFAVDKIIDFGKTIINTTADLQSQQAQYDQVMGGMKGTTDKYLGEMANKWNKHPNELKSTFMQYYALLKSKGVSEQDAYKLSQQYLERTVDANAFANESMGDTTARFMGGIKGEYDSLDTAMVNLSATMLNDASQKKYGKKFDELTVSQQETLKSQEMLRQHTSAGVFGQGGREADSYANNLAMVKNTWSELLAKFGSPVLEWVNEKLKGLTEFLKNVDVSVIQNAFTNFGSYISDVFSPIVDDVKNGIQFLWDKFKDSGGIDTAKGALDGLQTALTWLRDNSPVVEAVLAGLTGAFVAFSILTGINKALGAFKVLMIALKAPTIAETLAQLGLNAAMLLNPFTWVAIAIGALIAIVILLWKNWDKVSAWLTKSWATIKKVASDVWDGIKTKISDTWETIKTKISDAITNIKAKITEFKDKLVAKFVEIKDGIVGKIKDMGTSMKDKFTSGVDDLVEKAKEIPQKIGDGIANAATNAVKGVKELGTKIIDTFKETLGIHSPSKVFHKLGGFVVAGLKNGITSDNIKNFAKSVFGKVTDGALNTWDGIKGMFSGMSMDNVKSMFSNVGGNIKDFFTNAFSGGGKGVQQWSATASKALMMTGQYTAQNLQALLMQMKTESGGNSKAINLWDSNAKKGIPSKGLMQVIDPTFKSYAMKGYNKDIYDPLSNIIASIRYAVSRYGSLGKAYKGHGYATGGIFKGTNEGAFVNIAENGGDEAVLPLSNKSRMKPFASAVASMMPQQESNNSGVMGDIYVPVTIEMDGETIVKKTIKITQAELARQQKRQNRLAGKYS